MPPTDPKGGMTPQAMFTPGAMFRGFVEACHRFEASRAADDAEGAFFAVFEALNWAVTLDDRLRVDADGWRPDTGAGLILSGVRYARHSVHHQWSEAFYRDDAGMQFPKIFPLVFWEWSWRRDLFVPRNTAGQHEYEELLAGRPVRHALVALHELFQGVVAED